MQRNAAVIVHFGQDHLVSAAVIPDGLGFCIGDGQIKVIPHGLGFLVQFRGGFFQKVRVNIRYLQQYCRIAQLVASGNANGILLRHAGFVPDIGIIGYTDAVFAVIGLVVLAFLFGKAVTTVQVQHHIVKAAPAQGQGQYCGSCHSSNYFFVLFHSYHPHVIKGSRSQPPQRQRPGQPVRRWGSAPLSARGSQPQPPPAGRRPRQAAPTR